VATLPEITAEVAKLEPEPYDLLVVNYGPQTRRHELDYAVNFLHGQYPHCRILALPHFITLDHLTAKQAEQLTRRWPE
jgi:hypothetical protein